ncbi:hypothetical protein D3C71_2232810 [compost metagenome]
MMSISPESGQPTCGRFAPSAQNAGHAPMNEGSFIRASILPYLKLRMPWVFIRAEV